ncbi:hypothetical protein GGF31_007919 [Allomyces arbusculus]|nr:hypothetical protein GGF31_007919 [Allomyces arbusculus]
MWYTYSQTHDQVAVTFTIPASLPPSARPAVRFGADTVHATIGPHTIISGKLYARINPFESLWQIEGRRNLGGARVVTLHLEKETAIEWPVVVMEDDTGKLEIDPTSMYYLAGFLEAIDPARALDLYERAAKAGHVPAMLKAAAFYEVGRENAPAVPVAQDLAKSFALHQQAANTPVDDFNLDHVAEAHYILATAYQSGHGAPANADTALAEFDRAIALASQALGPRPTTPPTEPTLTSTAAGGKPISLQPPGPGKLRTILVTSAFQAGLTCFQPPRSDFTKAREYWELSAAYGHPQSAFNLGVLYLNARGVDKDLKRAYELMQQGVKLDPSGALALPPGLEEAVLGGGEASEKAAAAAAATGSGEEKKKARRKRRSKRASSGSGAGGWLLALSVVGVVGAAAVYYWRTSRNAA